MNEWAKLLIPAALLAVIALLWQLIRPGITKLMFYFLNSEDGQLAFVKYCGACMNERFGAGELAASAVRTLQTDFSNFADRFVAFEEIQKLHGAQLTKMNEQLGQVPRLTESVDRFADSVDKLAESVDTLTKWRERVEGREEERRRQQLDNAPRRRQGDPE